MVSEKMRFADGHDGGTTDGRQTDGRPRFGISSADTVKAELTRKTAGTEENPAAHKIS